MRAFRPLPVGGADEDFGIVFALGAMEFVERHGQKITGGGRRFKRSPAQLDTAPESSASAGVEFPA